VILTLKVHFLSPHKFLFGCIFGSRLNSLAIRPVLRNIDGYAFTHSKPWHSGESLPRRPFATKKPSQEAFRHKKRAKRPLNNNQTQAQRNQTKNAYHRFLHRGEPHERPLSKPWSKELAYTLLWSAAEFVFFTIKTNDDESSSAQFQSNFEKPTACWSLVAFLTGTLNFCFCFFTCRITRLHHLILNIGAVVPYNHTLSACLQHCHSIVELRTVHNGISNRTRSVYYLYKITIKMAWKINWIFRYNESNIRVADCHFCIPGSSTGRGQS